MTESELRFDGPNAPAGGRVVIITGAGGGIGRTHALAYAKRGARVVVNDLGGAVDGSGSSATAAQRVVDEIEAFGGIAVANHDSVATWEGGQAIVQTAIDTYGRVDVLVNNAGILRDKMFHGMDQAMIDAVIDVHLKGAFFVSQPAFKRMREQGYGRIVFTTSGSGLFGHVGQGNYGAAKAGLTGLMRVLALEGVNRKIRDATGKIIGEIEFDFGANAVAPIAKTRMTNDTLGLGFDAPPESVSELAVFLGNEECHETGCVFSVGGARIAKIYVVETTGVVLTGTVTAEAIRDNLPEIGYRGLDGDFTYKTLMESIELMGDLQRTSSPDALVFSH